MTTQQPDALRLAFEQWLRSKWTAGYAFPKTDDGRYIHGEAQRFWECWQASSAEVEKLRQGGEAVAWADKAMELATDLAVESLRLGDYETRHRLVGYDKWKIGMVREKREAAREKLRQYLYTSPPLQAHGMVSAADLEDTFSSLREGVKTLADVQEPGIKQALISTMRAQLSLLHKLYTSPAAPTQVETQGDKLGQKEGS